MDQAGITRFVTTTFAGVDAAVGSEEAGSPEIAWGDIFFIYDPHRNLEGSRRFPFATIVIKDYGDFDNASNLDRPGVFRLNIGVSMETYACLFDASAEHDFTALDQLMPHPVYGRNHWGLRPQPERGDVRDAEAAAAGGVRPRRRALRSVSAPPAGLTGSTTASRTTPSQPAPAPPRGQDVTGTG
jgi:uncharacterized protein DUF6194